MIIDSRVIDNLNDRVSMITLILIIDYRVIDNLNDGVIIDYRVINDLNDRVISQIHFHTHRLPMRGSRTFCPKQATYFR